MNLRELSRRCQGSSSRVLDWLLDSGEDWEESRERDLRE